MKISMSLRLRSPHSRRCSVIAANSPNSRWFVSQAEITQILNVRRMFSSPVTANAGSGAIVSCA